MKLSERLKDWTDYDGAAYELGCSLGFFEDYRTAGGMWLDHAEKGLFWSRNPLGDFLFDTLKGMQMLGILEENEDGYRWAKGKLDTILKPS